MTIIVGSNAQGHHTHTYARARLVQPPVQGKKIKRTGIVRAEGRKKPPLPEMKPRHHAILRMVDIEDPISAREIGEVLGLTLSGTNSSLYALERRGLVHRVHGKGWVKNT